MKDSKRIQLVIDTIRGIWYQYPNMRLGQLISNVIDSKTDLFYVEDHVLIEKMKQFVKMKGSSDDGNKRTTENR